MDILLLLGIVNIVTTLTLESEKIEQECLIQNKDEFPSDLYLIKMAEPLKLSMFSVLLPFLMQYIFGLGQAILLTNQVVSVEQDLVAFGKTLLIKNFPNVVQCSSVETTNQLFEKLLKSSDTDMLEKLLKLFSHQNPQFEEKKVQEFLHSYFKLEKECGNLTAKLNVPSIPIVFFSRQGFLQEFQKELLTSYDEKVKKVELLHNILQTLGFIKPCLDNFYSTPIQKIFYFLRKIPISLALPTMNVVISSIEIT
jgi:hypothetical protein